MSIRLFLFEAHIDQVAMKSKLASVGPCIEMKKIHTNSPTSTRRLRVYSHARSPLINTSISHLRAQCTHVRKKGVVNTHVLM